MRFRVDRLALAAAVAMSISCGNTHSGRSALDITVTIANGAKSACVIVEAGDQRTDPMPVEGKSVLQVGVVRTARMPSTIPVIALGYSDAACQTRVVPTEQSDSQDITFEDDAVLPVALTVGPVTGPTDLDGDGSAVPQDCNDNDAAVHPGATEICTNKLDENCDGLIDCADPTCDGQACATGAICGGSVCKETQCADGVDNDSNQGTDCADPDCNARPCLNGGTCNAGICKGATSEVGLCNDGQDNDGDGLADCLDPDCAGQSCSDGTYCTSGETCQGTNCLGGVPVVCPATGPVCTLPATGVCDPGDGGCRFTLSAPDAGCDDGNLCTVSDSCNGDGGCFGQPVICATPPGACFQPTGVCQPTDGGCRYDPRPANTGTCDDGNNCTAADSCDGDGGCRGAQIACLALACNVFANACTDAGTCIYNPTPGVACDGGTCSSLGACVPAGPWSFGPSNFTGAQVPAPSAAVSINCTTAAIRTQVNAPEAVFEGWCGGAAVPTFALGTSTATAPVVISMLGLTITNNNVLRVYGERPVILAVQGNVQIDGELNAGAVTWQNGAGGNKDCPTASRPSSGTCNANACGGGGGAGYGAAGRDAGAGEGSGAPAGVYGAAWGNPELIPLVGGCAGAPGGAAAVTGADGGGAGGGLQVSATGTVTINDRVTSVGGGGAGAAGGTGRGAGGGGSGGAVLIEAQGFSMGNNGWISCNAGAGGEGSDNNSSSGAKGADGVPNNTTAATGGTGGANNGGNGGQGGTVTNAPADGTPGTSPAEHGGGGGGGAGMGRIRLNVRGTCSRGGGAVTGALSVKTLDAGTCP